MRVRVRLDTMSDINKFVRIATSIPEKVFLEDTEGHKASAKSILGVLYSMEFDEIYCTCDRDISGSLLPWII